MHLVEIERERATESRDGKRGESQGKGARARGRESVRTHAYHLALHQGVASLPVEHGFCALQEPVHRVAVEEPLHGHRRLV